MLDAVSSRAAKEHGQQLAIDFASDWKDAVLLELRGWSAIHKARGNSTMTLEQFRAEARSQPDSHKAWGALPAIACRAGLIAPKTHSDGSPVMRNAESVKTRAHPVRVWALCFSAHPQTDATCHPKLQDASPSECERQPTGLAYVSDGPHGGDSAGLLAAVSEFHRGRA
jgi:hypothetical protein